MATAGNVLGSVINWVLGRYLIHFQDRRWFPIKGHALEKATRAYQRWGVWTLLLAWVPLIGDPLTLVAGIFRTHSGCSCRSWLPASSPVTWASLSSCEQLGA